MSDLEGKGQSPRFTFSRSEKINMGNYASVDVFVSVSMDADGDIVDVVSKLNKQAPILVNALEAEISRQKLAITPLIAPAEAVKSTPSRGGGYKKYTPNKPTGGFGS